MDTIISFREYNKTCMKEIRQKVGICLATFLISINMWTLGQMGNLNWVNMRTKIKYQQKSSVKFINTFVKTLQNLLKIGFAL